MIRLEICGGIASGKTTLGKLLERLSWPVIFEDFRQNPFWAHFYRSPQQYAFETETTFLLQHYSQIKTQLAIHTRLVCDFSLLQDRAYADLNLKGGQLAAFTAMYAQVVAEIACPSLIVRLECSAEQELKRIRHRDRPEEVNIRTEYLDALNRAIVQSVARVPPASHVLMLNSEHLDFSASRGAQEIVAQQISGALSSLK